MASYLDGLGVEISRLVELAMRMRRYDKDGVSEIERGRDSIEFNALVPKIVHSALKLAGISADGHSQSEGLMERHGYTRTNNIVIDEQGITINCNRSPWLIYTANGGDDYFE